MTTIIQDSHEKLINNGRPTQASAISQIWTGMGIRVVRKRLAAGDYMIPKGAVSVERKGSISEIAYNVADIHATYPTGTDKRTNWEKMQEECDVAWIYNQHLVMCIPHGQHDYKSLDDIRKWHPWTSDPSVCWWCAEASRAGVTGDMVADRLAYLIGHYGIDIIFCDDMAQTILDILMRGGIEDDFKRGTQGIGRDVGGLSPHHSWS